MEMGHIAMGNEVLDVCDSGFERDLGGELLNVVIDLGLRSQLQGID